MWRRSFLGLLPSVVAKAGAFQADIAIIGGSLGGCGAAIAALRNGLRVILSEETRWIGGQITSQLVPALDEHRWIEATGATRAYREFRNGIRRYYRDHYPLTPRARENTALNPGNGWVSFFSSEPLPALKVLEATLAPYLLSGQLRLLLQYRPVAAQVDRDRVCSVALKSLESGGEVVVDANYFLDATELGDLLPLTKTEYVTGFESRKMTGEPTAPEIAQPANEQGATMCFAMDYLPGEDHTINKPEQYGFWRDYVPALKPAWPGKLLSWRASNPKTLAPRELSFDPTRSRATGGNLWLYRRIACKEHFAPGMFPSDISVVNWPQNDYLLGRFVDVTENEFARHVHGSKQLSLSLLYWMQTEAPRPGGGYGWKGLRLRPDIAGTADGMAMYPYIREARRILAETTIVEQHVSPALRPNQRAAAYPDSVGIGSYRIDLHPSTGGDNYIDIPSLPFQIPLGALLPRRMDNLLAAAKNIGTTHITNGCYRLHPVEWNIGEAAAMAAAEALRTKAPPRAIRQDPKRWSAFEKMLEAQGVVRSWPNS